MSTKANEQPVAIQFTPKQRLFIAAYVKTKNAKQAAIAAGYSVRSAQERGYQTLQIPSVKAEVERRIAALIDRYEISAANITRELASMAFASIDDFVAIQDDGSAIIDLSTATKRQLRALQSIDVDEEFKLGDKDQASKVKKIKLKMADKRAALMDLAKLARMLPADRLEHSGSIEHRVVPEEHKIDIEAMGQDEREQLRRLLLRAGQVTDVEDESE